MPLLFWHPLSGGFSRAVPPKKNKKSNKEPSKEKQETHKEKQETHKEKHETHKKQKTPRKTKRRTKMGQLGRTTEGQRNIKAWGGQGEAKRQRDTVRGEVGVGGEVA